MSGEATGANGREVLIVGGGIGGLTLALCLHERGVPCRVFEAAPELKPLGVGVSLLPHGTQILSKLGLLDGIAARAVEFRESCFFNGFGQFVFRDPAPPGAHQFLVHRADLHEVLVDAVLARLGAECLRLGHKLSRFEQDGETVKAWFEDETDGRCAIYAEGAALIGCDGIHSVVRSQIHPGEGDLVGSGINMWRGLTRHKPFLSGGSHVRIGSLRTGKLVLYPVRNLDDGTQLVNWVAEVMQGQSAAADWNKEGRLEDFEGLYSKWRFDWLDVPDLLRRAEVILEYPMADRDPLEKWTRGRVTLLGDAAHPMLPRGSNGAMQAIIDGAALADELARDADIPAALARYEAVRREAVNRVVLTNRSTPPDILIETVHRLSGDRPFGRLEDVISEDELRTLLERYKTVSGYDSKALERLRT